MHQYISFIELSTEQKYTNHIIKSKRFSYKSIFIQITSHWIYQSSMFFIKNIK